MIKVTPKQVLTLNYDPNNTKTTSYLKSYSKFKWTVNADSNLNKLMIRIILKRLLT